MHTCVELAELAMHCARIAAARAESEPPPAPATRNPRRMPAPPQASAPLSHAPEQPELTLAALRHGFEAAFVPPAGSKTIDPLLLFTRLAAIVRACLALETRLAKSSAKPLAPSPISPRPAPRPAPAPLPNKPARKPPPLSPIALKPEGRQARRFCDTTSLTTLTSAPALRPLILPGLCQSPVPSPRATDPPRPSAA